MAVSKQEVSMSFKNSAEVKAYAEEKGKTLLILSDYVLDVSTFQCHHPGGGAFLSRKNLQSIDEQMKFHQPLSLVMANTMVIGSFKKEISRVIDPDRPLMPQIWDIDHEGYMKVINSPHWLFVPSPRMFESDFFQFFSHNKWWSITLLPSLLILFLLYSVPSQSWAAFRVGWALLAAVLGVLSFSLVEYILHRFVFHSEKWLPDSNMIRYVHYVMHGIHHMLPNDPLVYPPALGVITFLIGRTFMTRLIPIQDPLFFTFYWIFFFVGYMSYDVTHYSLHHIDTTNNKQGWFHKLQQYHNQHHFGGEEAGFGVTSPLWDFVFRTGFTKSKKH